MASTFSPTLRLELVGDGDQSGIWGQTTNNNLGALVEQAITGVINISMLDANYTLSNFNGVVDEARNQVLVLTGTLSTQRSVIAPLVEKTYIIKNSTTGGFGVQIIGLSGTGVIVPNGITTSVYCDGVNFYPTSTGSTGNQTINGNLAVTGTTTLTGALSGSTAVFSGAISSVNPTFTGTPTAPTATAGTNTTQIATTAFVQNVAGALGTMSTQNANNVAITGGSINGTTIGASATASIAGTTGNFSGNLASLGSVSGATGVFGAVSGTTITSSTQFTGPGTGLTGTAASLSIGGNAATATSATNATNLTGSGTISSTTTGTTQPLGTNNTTLATTAFVRSIIPAGVILMWSGSIASVPSGWYLCNGSNGTPDLRDRFVVGAGSTYAVAATGGSADAVVVSHTHTATSIVSDPGHVHPPLSPMSSFGGSPNNGQSPRGDVAQGTSTSTTGSAVTGITVATTNTSTGVSGTNQNLPPYYALAYIMKA